METESQGEGAPEHEDAPSSEAVVESPDEPMPFWKNPALRFIFLFTAIAATLGLSPLHDHFSGLVDSLADTTARIQFRLFDLFTDDVGLYGKKIVYEDFSVVIVEECTGVYEAIIFASGVIAFPTSLAKKAIGVGLGLPLLFVLNIIRISVLLLVGRFLHGYFETMHVYFWPITLLLMIGSAWLLWINLIVSRGEGD